MDDSKFKIFINKGLRLTRADFFTKDDHFEAEYTQGVYDLARYITVTNSNGINKNGVEIYKDDCDKIRKHSFVNCWTKGNTENIALWRLYGGNGNGVAIKTTVGKIKTEIQHCIATSPMRTHYELSLMRKRLIKIQYIDHHNPKDRDLIEGKMHDDQRSLLCFKNVGYVYENEYRLIFDTYQGLETGNSESEFHEIILPIHFDKIISSIIVSPYACNCYYESIKKLSKELDLKCKVNWSKLKFIPG